MTEQWCQPRKPLHARVYHFIAQRLFSELEITLQKEFCLI